MNIFICKTERWDSRKIEKKETQSSPKGFVSQNDNYKNKIKIYYVCTYIFNE